MDGQIGLEETPELWVARLVAVFREVRRVLRSDGTCWVEIGDSYVSGQGGRQSAVGELPPSTRMDRVEPGPRGDQPNPPASWGVRNVSPRYYPGRETGMKPKDLTGAPWLLAFALRADGWWLRSEIVWAKPNPMPESVSDRPTVSHSRVFLLAKAARYFYDAEAIREPYGDARLGQSYPNGAPGDQDSKGNPNRKDGGHTSSARGPDGRRKTTVKGADGSLQHRDGERWPGTGRNRRSVWTLPTEPYPETHFATWPTKLVEPMILAGTSERGVCPDCGAPWQRQTAEAHDAEGRTKNGQKPRTSERRGFDVRMVKSTSTVGWQPTCAHDREPVPATVLDPFAGAGTTCLVARKLGRRSIGIDLSSSYLELAARRLAQQSLFATEASS